MFIRVDLNLTHKAFNIGQVILNLTDNLPFSFHSSCELLPAFTATYISVYMAFVWDLYNVSLNSCLRRGIKNLFENTRGKFIICNISETSNTISPTACLLYVTKALKTGCRPCVAGLRDFAFCSAQLSTLTYMGKYLSNHLFASMTTCSSNTREASTMSPEQSMIYICNVL